MGSKMEMMEIECEMCKRVLNPETAVWYELSFETGRWYLPEECPPEESQGLFSFGPDCAKKVKVTKA